MSFCIAVQRPCGLEVAWWLWKFGGQAGFKYQEILEENIMLTVRKLKLGHHWTFRWGSDIKHTSQSIKGWFQKETWKILAVTVTCLDATETLWWD